MKRGKDDEKIAGPMFPRLHVNDADKGGPRAPPRNKMALYEQFSIPSQRFTSASNLVHPSGSSQVGQGSGSERNLRLPVHLSSPRPTHISENYYSRHGDEADSNASVTQAQQKRKRGDEDDFMVPVFVRPGMDHDSSKNQNDMERGKLTHNCTAHSMQPNSVCGENSDNTRRSALCSRREAKIGNAAASREGSSSRQLVRKPTPNRRSRDPKHGSSKQTNHSTRQYLENSAANMNQMSITNACIQPNQRGRPQHDGSNSHYVNEHRKSMEDVTSPRGRSNSNSGEVDNDCEYNQDDAFNTPQIEDADKSDDGSDTSMVESLGLEISPDHVVEIIGQKHFWKARRAIAHQQRVFAVQVFELHRLLKVQKLIAASPNLMFGKPSLKTSSARRLSSECVVKPSAHAINQKGSSEKPNTKMERSTENAVRTSQSSVKNGTQGSNNLLHEADQSPMNVAADKRITPWGFHQPYGHQWLIPVMSPSEGLIYKPYPAPGFVGTSGGGSLPVGSTPFPCGYMNPAYGYPPSHHYPGHGVLPGAPMGENCFPTYSMPALSGSFNGQMNSFSAANLQAQSNQLFGGVANSNSQPHNYSNFPTQQNSATLEAAKLQISKESEVKGSFASSPRGRKQGNEMVHAAEVVGALSHFEVDLGHQGGDQLGRVIKVVPHNPISATESVARIFQSIQKERNQLC